MTEETDYLYALEMQRQLNGDDGDSDIEEIVDFKPPAPAKARSKLAPIHPRSNLHDDYLNRTQNIVHPQWETLDPTPDIQSLFGAFDMKFFQNRLKCVTLEWSKRMYSCAGICYSRSNRFGMDVTIRLSEPLLKLRPRKDLVETMLHEMIHAYCFVLKIREGNGGHGPNFKKIMYGINKVAGTNITVYHTFHDEVQVYKQHWWRCNGSCQYRSPFFGYVKRTSNRAPSANDQWWSAHLKACGGTFMKIKGPEPKQKKERSSKAIEREKKQSTTAAGADMRKYFPTQASKNTTGTTNVSNSKINGVGTGSGLSNGGFKGPIKINGGGTMLLNPKTKRPSIISTDTNTKGKPVAGAPSIATAFPPSSYPGLSTDPFKPNAIGKSNSMPSVGNLANVKSLSDLKCEPDSSSFSDGGGNVGRSISSAKRTFGGDMVGHGYSLSSESACNNSIQPRTANNQVDRNHLRNLWVQRFGGGNDTAAPNVAETDEKPPEGNSKRRRTSSNSEYVADEAMRTNSDSETGNGPKDAWVVVDDDLMLQDKPDEVIALSSDSDGGSDSDSEGSVIRPKHTKQTAGERQNAIKQEILEETMLTDDDIELIDDDYNDDEDLLNTSAAVELADTSLIDDLFGEDTLLKEFKRENDVMPSSSRHVPNPLDDIITCPICQGKMKRSVFAEHLDGCSGIAVKVIAPKYALKKLSTTSKQLKPSRKSGTGRQTAKDILRKAGYSENDLANITSASSADDEEEDFIYQSELSSSSPVRPVASPQSIVDLNSSDECDESTRRYRQRNLYKTTRQCPVCAQEIEEDEINVHLDGCLNK